MDIRRHLLAGQAIPALPLALNTERKWCRKHQRALIRYYLESGTGGIAVGVHSTQFEIREPRYGLFEPLLRFASEQIDAYTRDSSNGFIKIAGLCGQTEQAVSEAKLAADCGYHAGLLSLAAMKHASEDELLAHCEAVSKHISIIGFYLQSAVGGAPLPYSFWKRFAMIENVVAIKMAPFNRYQTIDVIRAVCESGRSDISLYTGNDDNIIADLVTPWDFAGQKVFIRGGLLGQFGVWTSKATAMLREIQRERARGQLSPEWMSRNAALTDANAAIFDAANNFRGVLCGIHEVLRRQGLLETNYCLDPNEQLSPGQAEELDRVCRAYPWLTDDAFVKENLHRWLSD
ncbi:dihydrodipicolinate synthase family protein [Ruficoccus amylovorans]|nr:dihydrodipicolinate synthase family protein [Ruficoccus amylovorans]